MIVRRWSTRLGLVAARCPIRGHTPVTRLVQDDTGWLLRTCADLIRTRTVVVATGGANVPRTPSLARQLPGRIQQLHAADYQPPRAAVPRDNSSPAQ
jgi:putative flavoprotein involved in K+ transport